MSQGTEDESVVVRSSAADTDGESVVLEIRLPALAPGAPPHVHPEQEERLQVLQGTLLLRVDGHDRVIGPGERWTVPAGVAHAYSNPTTEPVHFVLETTPAHGPTIEVA